VQSAPLSQEGWNRLPGGRQHRSGSQSSLMPKYPSGGWPQRSLGPASSTHSRRGSISLHYRVPDWLSSLRSDGARAQRGVGNGKAGECEKFAAEEPDTRVVEWLNYSDRTEVPPVPLL